MQLNYLDFDYSEDHEGTGTLDAMASVTASQTAALEEEITRVLNWAHQTFPDACGPLEDGGIWQYDLRAVREISTPLDLVYDPQVNRLHVNAGPSAPPRTTVTLSLSGTQDFCGALREAFELH